METLEATGKEEICVDDSSDSVFVKSKPTGVFECRIFTPDNELKKVYTPEMVKENSQKVIGMFNFEKASVRVIKCKICKSKFETDNHNHHHCSSICRIKAATIRMRKAHAKRKKDGEREMKKQLRELNCPNCGVIFSTCNFRKKYCTDKCGRNAERKRSWQRRKAIKTAEVKL